MKKSRKPLSTSKLRKRYKKGLLNKGSLDTFKRSKPDSLVIRQHELYQVLKQYGVKKDFWKLKQWWDFAIETHRIVIKIIPRNYKKNNSLVNAMEGNGWKVLFVTFFDEDKESLSQLIKDVGFALSKPAWIEEKAKELNKELPRSEKWFREKIKDEWFYRKMGFEFNKPMFGRFIYDLFSTKYRLCIEVDGSAHDNPTQQQKDAFKTELTISKGFSIIRVQAYNDESYAAAIRLIEKLIENHGSKTYKTETQSNFNDTLNSLEKSGKLGF